MFLTGKEHRLKCWPTYFEAILDGRKPFDVRKDDRHFNPGDAVILQEWDPRKQRYTGRELSRLVTYVLAGPGDEAFGWTLPPDVVVLGYGVGCRP